MDMKRIRRTDRFYDPQVNKLDLPMLAGSVKMTLKNVHNGKTEVIEKHNAPTNALAHIFAGNYGGLMNYQNFEDLYRTWLGGVLVFGNPLDTSAVNDYGIPAYTSNPVRAHAGQTTLTDQADDLTRGNPDSSRTVTTEGSTKLVFEWGTSAGNGVISSLGLTHTDVGSYGCGVTSVAQKSLVPFVNVGEISRNYTYGDNANAVLATNGNMAYNFYLVDNTTVHIYKTPINVTRFKLQGGALLPITAYTQMITATLPNSYAIQGKGGCYYHFDFDNNILILFGVPTSLGETLYRDDIDLDTGVVTHQTITVTGASLWKFRIKGQGVSPSSSVSSYLSIPTKAIIFGNYLFVYGCSEHQNVVDKMYKVNLTNESDITEIDTTDIDRFSSYDYSDVWTKTSGRQTILGGIIVNDSFIINGDKVFQTATLTTGANSNRNFAIPNSISSSSFGIGTSMSMISVCKLYLATKFNLDTPVTKTSAQSMTVEYTLTEV